MVMFVFAKIENLVTTMKVLLPSSSVKVQSAAGVFTYCVLVGCRICTVKKN